MNLKYTYLSVIKCIKAQTILNDSVLIRRPLLTALLKISTDKRIKSNGSELSDSFFGYKKCSSDDYEHSFHLSVNSILICSGFALLPISQQIKSEVKHHQSRLA